MGDTFTTFDVEVFDRGDMLPLQDVVEEEGMNVRLLITGPGVLEGVRLDCRVCPDNSAHTEL